MQNFHMSEYTISNHALFTDVFCSPEAIHVPCNILRYRLVWHFRFVAVWVFGRFGLWPFRFVAVSVCGYFGLWPFRWAPRHQYCRDTCRISERYDDSNIQSRDFTRFGAKTSYRLVNRGLVSQLLLHFCCITWKIFRDSKMLVSCLVQLTNLSNSVSMIVSFYL